MEERRKRREEELAEIIAAIEGRKVLTYSRRANPWRQLSEVSLTAFPRAANPVDPHLLMGDVVPSWPIQEEGEAACACRSCTPCSDICAAR